MKAIPIKTIERLSLYGRLLERMMQQGHTHIYSHELASLSKATPAQVRRDLMEIGHSGNPRKGYNIGQLQVEISSVLVEPDGQKIALVGIGNLGRAILTYFRARRPRLSIAAAFDFDPDKINRVISGCRSYHTDRISEVVRTEGIGIGIVTVPAISAQKVADMLVDAGIKSIVNWAPVPLYVPPGIFLENRDITMSIEKAAYFAKSSTPPAT